ncbi:helix-turn-helix domain-containing protein [Kineococcus sp. SYSU DK018]|uniref:helix-turn-helix domain-containing protein n=1 Tax=Kineococcus sp. SYSU DK018 TaxID=3383139 RepID=UPI003D7E4FF7
MRTVQPQERAGERGDGRFPAPRAEQQPAAAPTDASSAVVLGDFLRAVRNHRRPQDVGLPAPASARRVPGLRRQEVADLADVSLDYYTRIEQGRVGEVSGAVLNSLSRALHLRPEEDEHLRRLAAPRSPRGARRQPRASAAVRAGLLALVEDHPAPAFLANPCLDVVAANLPWRVLATPPGRSVATIDNLVRWHFLDPYARELLIDWEEGAARTVAGLHVQSSLHPGDERVQELVAELLPASDEFRRMWAVPQVRGTAHGRERMRHPWAGEFAFDYESLQPPGDELVLAVFSPVAGTGSREVLDRLLAEHRRTGRGAGA